MAEAIAGLSAHCEELRVLEHSWHNRKLPRGALAGNRFELRLRDFALARPETTEDFPWGHTALKVRGKTFAWLGEEDGFGMTVKLPVSATLIPIGATAPPPSSPAPLPVAPLVHLEGIRVLVVDDHKTFADLLSLALSSEPDLDCVGTAGSAAEAVAMAAELKPDIVVMDIEMPREDGLIATRRIREVTTSTLIAELPELGLLTRKQITRQNFDDMMLQVGGTGGGTRP